MTIKRGRSVARDETPNRSERVVAEAVLNRRRRYALYYLYQRPCPVELDELIVQVAAWERCTTPEEVTSATCDVVGRSLEEIHLPYLAALDIVRYDRDRQQVAYCANDPKLAAFLANDPRTTVGWHRVYLVLTVVATVFVGLVWIGVPPFEQMNPIVAAGLVVALFALASVVHWYDVYRWQRRNENGPPNFLLTFGDQAEERERTENGERDGIEDERDSSE